MLTAATHGFTNDFGWRLGPDEGCRVFVPVFDVVFDVLDEGPDRREGTAPHGFACEDAEPGFDQVQPRGADGREVEVDVRVLLQPRDGLGRLREADRSMNCTSRATSVDPAR